MEHFAWPLDSLGNKGLEVGESTIKMADSAVASVQLLVWDFIMWGGYTDLAVCRGLYLDNF